MPTTELIPKPTETVLRTWNVPPNGVTQRDGTKNEMALLFQTLPRELSDHLIQVFPPNVLMNLTNSSLMSSPSID